MRRFAAGWLVVALIATSARGVIVNFDNVPSGTNVANQYPGMIFSSEPGHGVIAFAYGGLIAFSSPNVIVPYNQMLGFPTSVPDLYVDFTTPVNGLTFHAVQADEFGVVAVVNVYSGPTLLGIDPIIGNAALPATFANPASATTLVNLSAYANVTRIEIVPPPGLFDLDSAYGGGGLIYDNFSFDPVPEPAGVVVMLLAWARVRCRCRRRTEK
jgi:hypothetical protein